MHVIASDAAELAANAGGLIVDRMMSGWRVSVQLLQDSASAADRSVRILGAQLVDEMEPSDGAEGERCVLVMGADSYERGISAGSRQFPAGLAEILVWGESPDATQMFGHTLSAAALAFKAQAVAAADLPAGEVDIAEEFTSMSATAGMLTRRA